MAELETYGEIVPAKVPKRDKALTWSHQEIASAGAYIVTEKTVKAVEKALDAFAASHAGDLDGMASSDYDAAQKALATVREEALRDLGVS
jgi:hypothetical protein